MMPGHPDGPPKSERLTLLPLPALRQAARRHQPHNNLVHCFGCFRNFNNIDLLRLLGYDFPTTVSILERLLHRHQARLSTPALEQA